MKSTTEVSKKKTTATAKATRPVTADEIMGVLSNTLRGVQNGSTDIKTANCICHVAGNIIALQRLKLTYNELMGKSVNELPFLS